MEASEATAVERARAGDSDAFRLLVERHSRTVFRLAYRVTGNQSDAEDAVQETFLRAYRQMGSFDARASFSTWLCRIGMNCSLDMLRARQRRRQVTGSEESETEMVATVPSGDPSPERLAFSLQVRTRMAAALGELSAVERAAFMMRHFEGRPVEEIARALGRPNGATRHSVFRAVQKLRRALEPMVSSIR